MLKVLRKNQISSPKSRVDRGFLFENLGLLALAFKKIKWLSLSFWCYVGEEAGRISVYIVSDVSGALRGHGI